MHLRPMVPDDEIFVSILLETAYDGPIEAQLTRALREAGDMALELVAEDDAEDGGGPGIIGHIAFARLHAPAGWWSLASVSVIHSRQQHGLGAEIVRHGLDLARQAGAPAVVVTGEPALFGRFGFSAKAAEGLTSPMPDGVTMLYPIAPGTAGLITPLVYPPAIESQWPAAG